MTSMLLGMCSVKVSHAADHKESAPETVVCEQCVEVSRLHGLNTRNHSAYQSLFAFVNKSLNETRMRTWVSARRPSGVQICKLALDPHGLKLLFSPLPLSFTKSHLRPGCCIKVRTVTSSLFWSPCLTGGVCVACVMRSPLLQRNPGYLLSFPVLKVWRSH